MQSRWKMGLGTDRSRSGNGKDVSQALGTGLGWCILKNRASLAEAESHCMQPSDAGAEPFHVGDIRVEPRLNLIVVAGEARRLEPRVMAVLVHLAAKAGSVVTRDELMVAVWEDVFVSDKAMVQAVSVLRKALGDDWTRPRYIETISKTGYRLIAPVSRADEGASRQPGTPQRQRSTGGAVLVLAALGLAITGALAFWRAAPSPPPLVYGMPAASLAGNVADGVVSPDGRQLALAWKPAGSDNWDIYVKSLDDENVMRLTEDPARDGHPTWSPDGQFVAFIRRSGDGCEVDRVSVLGGHAMRLAKCTLSPLSGLSWSPDGRWIVRSDAPSRRKARRIVLLDVETGEVRPLTQPPEGDEGDSYPVFSPDGRSVAFVRSGASGLSDVYRISIASSRVERITSERRPIYGLDWSPDGKEIVFSSDRDGRVTLWRVAANGGEPMVFPVADQQIIRPSLARSERVLVYTKYTDNSNIWSLPLGDDGAVAGEAKILIASSNEDRFPQLSPDGARLAFISGRTGYPELWTSDLNGAHLIRHTQFESGPVSSPSWSPDGSALVFDARVDGQAALYTVGAEEHVPVRITEDPWDELNASWSRDGDTLYLSSNRSGSWQIWRRPARGGPATQVTMHGGFRALEGPDASTIYYAKHDTLGLWRTSAPLAAESLVIADLWIGDASNWTLTDEGVLFVRKDPRTIVFFDFASEATRPLYDESLRIPLADSSSLTLTADGRALYYTQIDGGGLDLMVVKGY